MIPVAAIGEIAVFVESKFQVTGGYGLVFEHFKVGLFEFRNLFGQIRNGAVARMRRTKQCVVKLAFQAGC